MLDPGEAGGILVCIHEQEEDALSPGRHGRCRVSHLLPGKDYTVLTTHWLTFTNPKAGGASRPPSFISFRKELRVLRPFGRGQALKFAR